MVAPMDVEELLRAVRDNQPGAWPRLVGPLTIKLRLYLSRWVGAEDAKDLTQATFVVLMADLPDFVPKKSLTKWVFGIARNLMKDELKARKRRNRQEVAAAEVQLDPDRSSSSHLQWVQRFEIVEDELERLPDHLRGVIEHDLADGEPEAFAQREGIALATVRTRRHRAHEMLGERVRQRSKTPTPKEKPTPPAI